MPDRLHQTEQGFTQHLVQWTAEAIKAVEGRKANTILQSLDDRLRSLHASGFISRLPPNVFTEFDKKWQASEYRSLLEVVSLVVYDLDKYVYELPLLWSLHVSLYRAIRQPVHSLSDLNDRIPKLVSNLQRVSHVVMEALLQRKRERVEKEYEEKKKNAADARKNLKPPKISSTAASAPRATATTATLSADLELEEERSKSLQRLSDEQTTALSFPKFHRNVHLARSGVLFGCLGTQTSEFSEGNHKITTAAANK